MLLACWSVKGGSGTTVVSVAIASLLAEASPGGALIVDLAGDVPAALGLPEPAGPGITGWLDAGVEVPADALTRLEVPGPGRLRLLARGSLEEVPAEAAAGRGAVLAALLAVDGRPVVADCGGGPVGAGLAVAAAAPTSLLVLRPCYLSVRRALRTGLRPSGVVLVGSSLRTLQAEDVEAALGIPVVATVVLDDRVARAVDAGSLGHRLPRSLRNPLRHVA